MGIVSHSACALASVKTVLGKAGLGDTGYVEPKDTVFGDPVPSLNEAPIPVWL